MSKDTASPYQAKVEHQIQQYADMEALKKLPPIYRYWWDKHIAPRLTEVLGVADHYDFYVKHFSEVLASQQSSRRIASIGSGDGVLEIKIAKALVAKGVEDFIIEGLEISPIRNERARVTANEEGVGNFVAFSEADLNDWQPEQKYCAIYATHTLHHLVELEKLFKAVDHALIPEGLFLTNDMIGRNGHMRWPEALEIIQGFWKIMPDHYKYQHQLRRHEDVYINWDCAQRGFEGIRAQDILPLLVEHFSFEKFLGYGNLPDLFIDRGFGHNLQVDNEKDCAFVDLLEMINSLLIDLGHLKPTMCFAVMRKKSAIIPTEKCYRNWSASYCVRHVEKVPDAQTT